MLCGRAYMGGCRCVRVCVHACVCVCLCPHMHIVCVCMDVCISSWRYQNLFIDISKQTNDQDTSVDSANYSCIRYRLICIILKECCHSVLTNSCKVESYVFE